MSATTAYTDGSGEVLIEEIHVLNTDLDETRAIITTLSRRIDDILDRLDKIERRIDWSTPETWS